MNNDIIQILNDMDNTAISLLLGILGIGITIFTVIYSFMESTQQKVKNLDVLIQQSTNSDPRMEAEYQISKSYLSRLRIMNRWILGLIIGDLAVFALFSLHMFKTDEVKLVYYSFLVLGIYLLLCIVVFAVYVWQYIQRFKNV